MKKSRKYKKYIRKQIKKQLQTTANSLEQKIQEKEGMKQFNLSKVLDDTLQVFIEAKNSVKTSSEILSKSISFFKIITSLEMIIAQNKEVEDIELFITLIIITSLGYVSECKEKAKRKYIINFISLGILLLYVLYLYK